MAAQQPQPRFRTDVNVVEVDVVVVDESGQPLRGLQQQDFEVLEDGKPVDVATFSAVDIPAAPPDAGIPAADTSGTAAATNAQAEDGRVILVVLDDYHVSFDAGRVAAARSAVRRLIERLGPSDLAAVIATSGNKAMQAEFTADKPRLLRAVDRFFPQSEVRASGVAERPSLRSFGGVPGRGGFNSIQEIKTRWAMEALSNAAKALALIPHRRKAVLLVSQGVPISLEDIITNQYAGGAWQGMRDFIVTAQRSNIAVYPVDPCGLTEDAGCSQNSRENLRSIAEGTGGFAVLNTNAPERGVDRIVAENGTYYLLGYYSPAPPNDGRRHRITVRVRRPDVEVRAREGYLSPRRGSRPPEALPPLDALINAPIQTRGLPMRVAAVPAPLGGRPGSAIAVTIELPAEDAVRAGHVAFAVVALDTTAGQVRSRQQFTSGFQGTAPSSGSVARVGTRVDVPHGRYQLRIAAAGPNGLQGSVFTEVEVPEFDRPLALGGLSLSTTQPVPEASAGRLGGVLPHMPLAARDLVESQGVMAQIPIRTSKKAAAATLTIRSTLTGPDGKSIGIDDASRAGAGFSGAAGQVYRVPLPPGLAPGEYRLAVQVTGGGQTAGRELVFRVGPGPKPGEAHPAHPRPSN
jgi:VWFA-related protein